MRRILTAGPVVTQHEVKYVMDAVTRCVDEHWDDYLIRFADRLADYLGVKHVLLTSSCTGAMHIALLALGIGPGDEVIVPEISWVATADMVLHVGATPVFADVEPDTWCIDAESARRLVTERTRAVVPVHLYGHPANLEGIGRLAGSRALSVLEDAAPAIGASVLGQPCGTLGHFGAFSFAGAKLLTTGRGGALVTDNDDLYEAALAISDHGCPPEKTRSFWIDRLGVNYALSNIQAAFGLGQLEHIDEMLAKKRRLFEWYQEGLAGVSGITLLGEAPWAKSAHWMTRAMLDEGLPLTRDEFCAELDKRNIDTRPAFPPMSQFPIWGREIEVQPVAKTVGERGLNLPTALRLSRKDVDYVCRCTKEILGA